MNAILLGVLGYVLVQLLIGVALSRRIKNEADYLLAGRSLGLGIGTFTIFATWFGAETVVGAAGSIYAEGLSGGAADPFGYGACLILMGLFFAAPLWRRGLTTFADLFRQRYSANVERLAVILLVPTSIMWGAAQIRAFGQVIAAVSTFDVEIAITVAAGVVIVYTVYGGLLADAYTDVIQGLALVAGLIVLFVVILDETGGMTQAASTIEPRRLNPFAGASALAVVEQWAIPICGSVLSQELVARVLATRSPQVARRAALLGGGIYLSVGMIPVFIGLVGVSLLPGLDEPEQLLARLAQQYLHTALYVMFAGAIISAILSTVDSALLAASALMSHNLVVPLAPAISEAAKVRVARAGVMVFGLIAYVLALYAEGVYALVEEASAFGSAGVFVAALFALFTPFGGAKSATAALLAGVASWVLGAYVLELDVPYLVSLAAALLSYVTVAVLEGAGAKRPESETKEA
ncbi:sodium:solute symporter [Sulfurifustis variabilis]|uniref:Sodium:solute symporter n=1 Tax=Sulfurifustis variabilis TaxID=1675686 RepID=A0A1B4V671_9GAMM|nr:sodium:solute symporter family protein [Sulfurifustis variabilis]BAU49029.1 sodium:solute symporter [Sulfurifustis variabilis]